MLSALEQITQRDLERIHSKEYRMTFRRFLADPNPLNAKGLIPAVGLPSVAYRAMGTNVPVSGGYLAPADVSRQIWQAMTASSVMRSICTISETSDGADLIVPFVDDTAQQGRIVAENSQITETDFSISGKRIPTFMHSSDLARVSLQLHQDVDPAQIEELLVTTLAERVARLVNNTTTAGSGANSPQGIVTAATVGVTGSTGQTTTVGWTDLVALTGSVTTPYVYGKTGQQVVGKFMMHRSTFETVKKLTDGEGRPIWDATSPMTLAGFRVAVNDDVPQQAASAKSVLFGDFTRYAIRDAATVVSVLTERFAEYGQLAYHLASRHGGQLIDPLGVKAYQNSAT